MKLESIAEILGAEIAQEQGGTEISGLSADSTKVKKGRFVLLLQRGKV